MQDGSSFLRHDIITRAHENCEVCQSLVRIATEIFQDGGRMKTRSMAGPHWVEVTRKTESNINE